MSNDAAAKKQIRAQMRTQRRLLSDDLRKVYSRKLCQQLVKTYTYQAAKNIALYLPNDGEISLRLLINLAWLANKNVYLPVVKSNQDMEFAKYKRGDKLDRNKYHIQEPQKKAARIQIQDLDLVLLPLVAFDKQGNRLGMGGGYYDRAFKFKRYRKKIKPILFGVAYHFQYCDTLPTENWDIGVNAIITNSTKHIVF